MKTKLVISTIILSLVLITVPQTVNAFTFEYVDQSNYHTYESAGFFSGTWHGLIAPYSLVVRWFSPLSPVLGVDMYAYNNTGWFYDAGFLLGVLFSIPIGWLAAIIAFIITMI